MLAPQVYQVFDVFGIVGNGKGHLREAVQGVGVDDGVLGQRVEVAAPAHVVEDLYAVLVAGQRPRHVFVGVAVEQGEIEEDAAP